MDKTFSTFDLIFAAFLLMEGVELLGTKKDDAVSSRVIFEFNADIESDKMRKLIEEWNDSTKARDLKRFAGCHRKLKTLLAKTINV